MGSLWRLHWLVVLLSGDRPCHNCPTPLPAAPDAWRCGSFFHGETGRLSVWLTVFLTICLTDCLSLFRPGCGATLSSSSLLVNVVVVSCRTDFLQHGEILGPWRRFMTPVECEQRPFYLFVESLFSGCICVKSKVRFFHNLTEFVFDQHWCFKYTHWFVSSSVRIFRSLITVIDHCNSTELNQRTPKNIV